MSNIKKIIQFLQDLDGGDVSDAVVENLREGLTPEEDQLLLTTLMSIKKGIEWAATKVVAVSGKLATMDDPMEDNALFKAVDALGSMGVPVPLIALFFKAINIEQDPKKLLGKFLEGIMEDPLGFAKSIKEDIDEPSKEPSDADIEGIMNELQDEIDKFHDN